MHTLAVTLRAFTLWAMIPLTLLSGTPVLGCVCANGEHKLLCQRRNGGSQDASASAPCSCCEKTARGLEGKALKACCLSRVRAVDSRGDGAGVSTRCCTATLEIPNPSVVAQKCASPDDAGHFLPLPLVCFAPIHFATARLAAHDIQGDLPPPDLVIVHHVFLI